MLHSNPATMLRSLFIAFVLVSMPFTPLFGQKTPLMGWASWNQFGVQINEKLIQAQADAMVSSGLANAGFQYINIDDGFFNGRYDNGALRINTAKFPKGMKPVADYIHSRGLKAGFYSEAGANTCGSIHSNQPGGKGTGLYGYDQQDVDSIFSAWGYDFLKVDFCGGQEQKLDEETRYTEIKNALDKTGRNDINYNICRWQFPGVWVTRLADSWRVSHDINFAPGSAPQWSSIISIIDLNTYLAPFASPGHYNDMDMLEVGRGLSYEEDKSHFSMWCMLSSPLLLGNDLRYMTQQTIDLLTNKEVIAVNQDTTGLQAHLISDHNGLQVWAKNLNGKWSHERAVVLFNRRESTESITFNLNELNLIGPASVRDLWAKADLGTINDAYTAKVPAHGVILLKIVGASSKLKEVFEGEYAWINNFNLTRNSSIVPDQGRAVKDANGSGGAKAGWLGRNKDNFIEFRDVNASHDGPYTLSLSFISGENRKAVLSINGRDTLLQNLNSGNWSTIKKLSFPVQLIKGNNTIRLSNPSDWMPDIDKIHLNLNEGTASFSKKSQVDQKIGVYPNPADTFIQVVSSSPVESIELYSSKGQLLGKYQQTQIQTSHLRKGSYLLKVKTDKFIDNLKFTKK